MRSHGGLEVSLSDRKNVFHPASLNPSHYRGDKFIPLYLGWKRKVLISQTQKQQSAESLRET